ncbi:3652_t:CDS:1 [Paraglomus occultum]|uniref:3652_t:CDS:1 n=1 Tax=Paraglomus occultum TaxID=144539 RepID=A0A9N9B9L2_9GLOM|nr:3652_t:CDS:1 [Paraglomus occultum]
MYFKLNTLLLLLAILFETIITSSARRSNLHVQHHGKATWFYPGVGACGVSNTSNDLVVSIPAKIFDKFTPHKNPNENTLCGKQVSIEHEGIVIYAVIADRCSGCSKNNIDLSLSAFALLDDPNKGVISVTWKILN